MYIRNATSDDLENIYHLLDIAKSQMINLDHNYQWDKPNYPHSFIKQDILNNVGYVIIYNNEIIAYFALIKGIDPTYINIDGAWVNDNKYLTIHRLASCRKVSGIFLETINFAKKLGLDIRIDTHENNKRMIYLLDKYGLKYCGVIICNDGTPRRAYQLVNKEVK